LEPALLSPTLTRLLTFLSRTEALTISGSGIWMVQLTTMEAFTTSYLFHRPQDLREEKPRSKENPPAKQMGSKKRKKIFYLNVLKKSQPATFRYFQTGQIKPLSFRR
jgi:hypothetical protein